ncbi:glutamate synthase large subunit [Psychrobacillus lasiicapitis]|uniref:Glutamate synthase large subunit n=1 Tax=Psychrobacillus lasiicapitis TaxID=1636719 RepID=A0A544THE0_9BACI|nr:glutamate synthase large subunit [Psychrobacillus lasiicapitis]TQR16882.1 glutamate synthase large subunit [Psychrobacillus lasiicapitis]GGA26383.1 glutamate synthase [NADPH] large chain [Psychrobacillus lasiicapitis]
MTFHQIPKAQGMYDPAFEHDACGIGLYAHIKGKQTHDIVKKGLEMLCRLDHRAGRGSDGQTGDGAGLMVQIPDVYFRVVCNKWNLPESGAYGVGMLFFTNNTEERQAIEQKINETIVAEGQELIGWRTVPINAECLSEKAKETAPVVRQVFIKAVNTADSLAFERKLYVIRKQVEHWAHLQEKKFYCASLSSQTIVYKGLLTPEEVDLFYVDLQDELFMSAFSLVHSRYSTNTFPSWERAHPNRYIVHNGEINTLRGNINWMKAREQQFVSKAFGEDLPKLLPIIDTNGSDSSMLDNAFEFFVLAGRTPAHTAMMLIPEPWTENPHISEEKKAFYAYHSSLMEPWDGPTAISFTDGKQIGAILDRNGLRPARYYVTKDDYIIFSSEVGVVDVEEDNILIKERLSPGKMLLVDLEQGRIISDEEIKSDMANALPYGKWLNENLVSISPENEKTEQIEDLLFKQKVFGYTYEDIQKYIVPLALDGKDPIGSMGSDTPLAVLSDRPQSLFNYFKQLFAQVTNPPIDSIREHIVTSTMTLLGAEGDLLQPAEQNSKRIFLDTPILTNCQLKQLRGMKSKHFQSATIYLDMSEDLENNLNTITNIADEYIAQGISLLILSDRQSDVNHTTIPVLLAASSLHQHLLRTGNRTKVSIIVESGEAREVHQFATLIGYGVDAINPYLAFATIAEAIENGHITISYTEAVAKYSKGIADGVVKVMSKMGISTVQSYRGAQVFEAVGISKEVIDRYFTGTASQIGGINLETIAEEAIKRYQAAHESKEASLESGSDFQWRSTGEHHAFNPKTIHTLQWATRRGDYGLYRQYAEMANEERIGFLRNLLTFKKDATRIPLDQVESVDSIVKRFKTGAMSFGSLSKEAHETLAIAMNRIGGKSNSGEGGEHPSRYELDLNGDNRRSAIKQIASGRFGVKSHYLVQADELQIKMAQGAKPGEGGQLPGNKVYPWVADVRGSTTGVGLISPPPHHDIYSIEDMAQLIHDLKNANRAARISVKLVAKSGVGTIAAGVAKGAADVIVISGYDGGTGASPKTSIKHTGLPWELGLAEAHQTLMLNGLRDRVRLETDGKLMTGKDVVMAALLGAEEYGFATAPLIVLGCVMMRACHLDTCPVGIATQNPELRDKFTGSADYVVNFMKFVAEEVREYMALLGFRTVEEMVGRTDVLEVSDRAKNHWKAKQLNLSALLYQPEGTRTFKTVQNHKIEQTFDLTQLLPKVEHAILSESKVDLNYPIANTDRVVGTIIGSEISKLYGARGLAEDSITLRFTGAAGQSFGAFVPKGMSMYVTGDVNDYFGKGLSGGKLIVSAPLKGTAEENVIAGNVTLYGATSGTAFINGRAGERFAVRNSGVDVVVEGIGDHGCEYMTGGRAVILGDVGKNFGAGMSGGIAYVLVDDDLDGFKQKCNMEMIGLERIVLSEERHEIRQLIMDHYYYTKSTKAMNILDQWDVFVQKFVKVVPNDYKLMLTKIADLKRNGLTDDAAAMQAFLATSAKQEKKQTVLAKK